MAIEDFKRYVRDNPFIKEAVDARRISWQKAYEHYDIYKDQNWDFLKPIKQENVIETVVESSGGSKGITLPIPSLSDIDFNQVGRVLEQLTNLVGMAKDVLSKSPSSDSLEKKIFERYKD